MSIYPQQLPLNFESANPPRSISGLNFRERLVALLTQDLDFHGQDSSYASHNFHSFPAKFPPQLPRRFIAHLTEPDDIVLDPMAGSGTTVLEAFLAGRFGIGCDIDPLALMLSRVKTMPLSEIHVIQEGNRILSQASFAVRQQNTHPVDMLNTHWDAKTRQFIDYWFAPQTQRELQALITAIRGVVDPDLRLFFELVFSSIIITKTGGVSLALDLAHTRPHRAKIVIDETTHSIAEKSLDEPSQRAPYVTKTLRSPLEEFEKRFHRNAKNLQTLVSGKIPPGMAFGDAQNLPLADACVDLIVTSPPYASNAIDYMRAHKFSLVWLGYPIDHLGRKRSEYIGGESTANFDFEPLPERTSHLVTEITELSPKKGLVLRRYYSEMTRSLKEMFRVLKPGKGAIVVVGSSIMQGRDTETQNCLAEIGEAAGFEVPRIGVRVLDRDRRMMPAGSTIDRDSQIQQRMHKEYVIAFYKPDTGNKDQGGRAASTRHQRPATRSGDLTAACNHAIFV